jgi:uncharacterized repeat protein (TIGR02543 family)
MKRLLRCLCPGLLSLLVLVGCGGGGGGGSTTTYTVSYDGNGNTGGSSPVDTATYAVGQTVTVLGNPNGLVRAGFVFGGWNTQASGTGVTYPQGQTFTMGSADVTLYATWIPTFSVAYDGNGSTGGSVPVDPGVYQQGQTVVVLGNTGDLVKLGSSFTGWNTQADGTGTTYSQDQTFTMGSADVTLHAQWTALPTYTVTYGGNGSTGGTVPVDTTHYLQGQSVTVLGNPGGLVRSGYTFAGWNQNCQGTGTTYTQGQTFTMPGANVALCAYWTANPTYTVTYNGNGSTGGSVPFDSTHYQAGQTVTVLGNTGNLVKSGGYSFTAWNTLANGTGASYAQGHTFVMGSSNVTLYATWATAKQVFVTTATLQGAIGAVPIANSFCQIAAVMARLPGVYFAWLSDSAGNSPQANFVRASVPYVDVLGNVIANNWTDLVSGSLRHPINHTETGALASAFPVWTFTSTTGAATMHRQADTCLGVTLHWYDDCDPIAQEQSGAQPWLSTGGTWAGACLTGEKALIGDVGLPGSAIGTWTDAGYTACSNSAHLYCFQQ